MDFNKFSTEQLIELNAECQRTVVDVLAATDKTPQVVELAYRLSRSNTPYEDLVSLGRENEAARRLFLAAIAVFLNTRSMQMVQEEISNRTTRN